MKAVEMALKMEQETIDFYRQCAERAVNPIGKKMFLSIVEDEQYHIACVVNMQKGQEVVPASSTPLQDMQKLFEQHKEAMLGQVPSTADEIDALRVAMQMEKEAIDFYKNAAAQAATSEERNLFECLIKDEQEHYRIFQNTSSFLEDSGNWFMWEQRGIVEG